MITFEKRKKIIILKYSSDGSLAWLTDRFKNDEGYTFSHTFHLTKSDLVEKFDDKLINENKECGSLDFKFGVSKGEYYKIKKTILGMKNALYIHKNTKLEKKLFIAEYKISIFKCIDDLVSEPIHLGGEDKHAISYNNFQNLLKRFPNTTEKAKYCQARLSVILASYFKSSMDVQEKYEKYMNRKKSFQGSNLLQKFGDYEKNKYLIILQKLESMLRDKDNYNEIYWQKEIIEILCLIFPKYVKAFKNVKIKDSYKKNKKRELDYLLIDSEGHIDIVEIKKPLDGQIVSKTNYYRENHVPMSALSGTVMQVEKYILHLNKWGGVGENILNKEYKERLPFDLKIKITNPGAMIILGRSNNLNTEQKMDFEIIKRKYKNIIDIITYDDLIRRLKFTISQYEL